MSLWGVEWRKLEGLARWLWAYSGQAMSPVGSGLQCWLLLYTFCTGERAFQKQYNWFFSVPAWALCPHQKSCPEGGTRDRGLLFLLLLFFLLLFLFFSCCSSLILLLLIWCSLLEDEVFLPALNAIRRGNGCMKLFDLFLTDSLFWSHSLVFFLLCIYFLYLKCLPESFLWGRKVRWWQ